MLFKRISVQLFSELGKNPNTPKLSRESRGANCIQEKKDPNTETWLYRFQKKKTKRTPWNQTNEARGQVRTVEAGESEPDGPVVGTCSVLQVHSSDSRPRLWKKIMHRSTEKKDKREVWARLLRRWKFRSRSFPVSMPWLSIRNASTIILLSHGFVSKRKMKLPS